MINLLVIWRFDLLPSLVAHEMFIRWSELFPWGAALGAFFGGPLRFTFIGGILGRTGGASICFHHNWVMVLEPNYFTGYQLSIIGRYMRGELVVLE